MTVADGGRGCIPPAGTRVRRIDSARLVPGGCESAVPQRGNGRARTSFGGCLDGPGAVPSITEQPSGLGLGLQAPVLSVPFRPLEGGQDRCLHASTTPGYRSRGP